MELNITLLKNLTILFIEDDDTMLQNTTNTLQIFFKEVYSSKNIEDAIDIYEKKKPNMILSDIKLQGESGLEFIQYVRKNNYTIPVVLLTSYSDQNLLLEAVNLGIDGYIIKPLDLNNIIETFLKAIKRLSYIDSHITLTESLKYDYFKKELTLFGKYVELGEKERELFEYFIDNANKTLTRKEIIYHIWPLEEVSDSALKNLLSRLRRKIGENVIQTVKNKGWILYIGS